VKRFLKKKKRRMQKKKKNPTISSRSGKGERESHVAPISKRSTGAKVYLGVKKKG